MDQRSLRNRESRILDVMYVASVTDAEIRLTIDAALDLVNQLLDGEPDVRAILLDAGFSGVEDASAGSIHRVEARMRDLIDVFCSLPDAALDDVARRLTEEMAVLPIQPSIVDHGGVGHHWTPASARFDDKVLADVVMAFAQEVCDNGTSRFGVCGADDCDHLFYDATRNGSRRFCADPRCASRTHTADHRARRRASRAGTSSSRGNT